MKLHLPKGLRAALLACLALASVGVTKADSSIISINFATGDDVNVKTDAPGSVGGVSASGWMNILGNNPNAINGTYTGLTDQSGADVSGLLALKVPQNPWSPGNLPYTTLSDQIQRSYLDLSASNKWTIGLINRQDADVCVISDLVLYCSGDGHNGTSQLYSPVSVNGVSYIGGTNTLAGTVTGWGKRNNSSAGAYGDDTINADNTIKVTGLSGYISMENVSQNDSGKRATLAGMQIILDDTEQLFYSSDLTSVASEAASNLTWNKDGAESALADIAESARYLNFTNGTDATTVTFSNESVRVIEVSSGNLTLAGALSAETLFAKTGTEMTVNATLPSAARLNVGGLGTVKFVGNREFSDLIVYGSGVKSFKDNVDVTGLFYVLGSNVVLENSAIFNASSMMLDADNSVTLNGDSTLTATTMTLGADSSVTLNGGSTLKATAMTLGEGATVTLNATETQTSTLDLSERQFNRVWTESVLAAVSGDGLLKLKLGNNANSDQNELITTATTSPIDINVNVTFVGDGELSLVGDYVANAAHTLNISAGKTLSFDTSTAQLKVKRSILNVHGTLNANYIQLGHEQSGNYPGVINLYDGGSLKATQVEFRNGGNGSDSVFQMNGGVLEFTQNANSAFSNTEGAKGIVKLLGGTLKAETSSWFVNTDKTVEVGGVSVETATGKTITLNNIKLVGNISTSGNLVLAGTSTGVGSLSVQTGGNLKLQSAVTLDSTIENAGTFAMETGGSLSFTSRDDLTEGSERYYYDSTLDAFSADNPKSGNGYSYGSYLIIQNVGGGTLEGSIGSVYLEKENLTKNVSSDASGNISITKEESVSKGGLYYITMGGGYVTGTNETTGEPTLTFVDGEFVYQTGSADNLAADGKTTGLVICALKTVSEEVEDPDNPGSTKIVNREVLNEDKVTTLVLKNSLNENAVEGVIVQSKTILQLDGNSTTDTDGVVTYSIELDKATIETTGRADGSTFTPTLTLTGTGLYKMDQATGVDAVATTTDASWSGKVKVSDTELGGNSDDKFYITALNNLGSNIEISGLSGYAYDGATGATTPESPEVTANLVLKGTALTLTSAPLDADDTPGTLTFSGDLSGDGDIVNDSDGHVTLSGDISGWTGSYTASESTSLLTLKADAELNASVDGGSMKLMGALTLGKTMSLTGDLTGASTITLDGAALDATKTAITVGGEASGSGTLNFTTSSGDLDFLQDLSDGAEFKLLNAEGGIVGYDKATVNGQESSTQLAADGTEVRYYIAMNDTSVTLSKVTLGLTWHGDETNGWTSSTGFGANADAQLTKDSYVSFAGDGSSKVIVNSDQTVKGIAVDFTPGADRDAYTLSGKDVTTGTLSIAHGKLIVQNNLTVNELTSIHTGTSLTVEGEGGSLESEKMTNNGTLTIGSGSTVKVGSISGDGIVGGDGKLVVSGEISADIIAKNTGTIELEKLDKNVASKGVQGTLLVRESGTFTGNYNGATSIGTARDGAVQELAASEKLTVVGTAGTVELKGLDSNDADFNKLDGIATTGASVKLNNVTDYREATTVTLVKASSMEEGGVLDFTVSAKEVNAALKTDGKPTVTKGASLSLKDVTLKVHEVENTGLNFNAGGKEKDILLFVLNDQAGCSVSNVTVDMSDCSWMTKYFTNFRAVEGSVDIIADANTGYYVSHGGQTPNGTAGLALAGKAMFHLDPKTTAPDGALAQVLDMLDNHIATGNTGAMDKLGAALAGSSLSAVGLALADDVQRQLRSIRNRTTTMGVNQCEVNEDMPYVNGWISGDGNYRQLSESGTDAGYQVSSWGGTVGVDVDVNPNLTLGVAVSALFGDYTGKAADTLTGDLDTQYVSLFARVSTGSWVNTFVGTLGCADVDLERTIPGVAGKTTYKTNGMMFGFLYEVARTFALNDDATTCVQPLFNMSFSHTTLDSATEGGAADTRLTTDSASLTQFSLGLGGRLQSVVGENEYNRASIFEARALLKLDFGDRYNKLNTALAALPTATVSTRSNEKGVIGAELGATLTIPISQDAGSIFFDVNADFSADEVGVNGSVGYRVNF